MEYPSNCAPGRHRCLRHRRRRRRRNPIRTHSTGRYSAGYLTFTNYSALAASLPPLLSVVTSSPRLAPLQTLPPEISTGGIYQRAPAWKSRGDGRRNKTPFAARDDKEAVFVHARVHPRVEHALLFTGRRFLSRLSRLFARISMTLRLLFLFLVHISRRQREAASYDEGNYFISHFRISPPRTHSYSCPRLSTSSPKCAVPVVVPVSLRFKHGLLIVGLTSSLIPLSSLILPSNEDKYYLQYGIRDSRAVFGIVRVSLPCHYRVHRFVVNKRE